MHVFIGAEEIDTIKEIKNHFFSEKMPAFLRFLKHNIEFKVAAFTHGVVVLQHVDDREVWQISGIQ